MVGFMQLPAPRMPRNAMLDLEPISQAIDSNRRNALLQDENRRQNEELGLRRQAMGRAEARASRQDMEAVKSRIGKMALAGDSIQDPAQRAAFLDRILKEHPDGANLGPEYRDPSNAFRLIAAEAGLARDPREDRMADIKMKIAEAQLANEQRGPDTPANIREWEHFSKLTPEQQQQYLAMKRQNSVVVGDTLMNRTTGGEIANVGGAIERGEFAKGRGQDNADFVTKFPKVSGAYRSFVQKSDAVLPVLDRAIASVGPNTTGWGALLRSLPESDARALEGDLQTIRANLAFGELQDMRANSPTGGALGAVTERELDLLSSTQASLDQLQSGVRVKENLQIIRKNWSEIRRMRDEAFRADQERFRSLSNTGQPQPAAPTAQPRPTMRWNPETGDVEPVEGM